MALSGPGGKPYLLCFQNNHYLGTTNLLNPEMTKSELHYMILSHFLEKGYAPSLATIASYFDEQNLQDVKSKLIDLEEFHGVVLHPDKESVWIIHPLSTAPTNFSIRANGRTYWGNCAWCSLGAAALLQPSDVVVTTTAGAEGESLEIKVAGGKVAPEDYLVHFPVSMTKAWDNVVYTCSVMLMFRNEGQIDSWCNRHMIPKGDVQPIGRIWHFARDWYGNHLSRTWRKWTNEEAASLFRKHGLEGSTWTIPLTGKRF